jgi:hypothetical protein
MRSLFSTPLERIANDWWSRVDDASRKAFFAAVIVNVLAFGFEMTNLTLNHDDVWQMFIQDSILGHYLGRFGVGWLHLYTQNHYIMPFLQMIEGILLMSAYGVIVARFWGLRNATDMALAAAIMCVFPYMAQTYSYNTSMATYSLAHLLVALAVLYSTRATVRHTALAAVLYVAAYSIYQAVAANAATIFVIWLLGRLLFDTADRAFVSRETLNAIVSTLVAAVVGGALYLAAVWTMHIDFDSSQAAGTAFRLGGATHLTQALPEIWQGTKSFFLWPERYFPDYLKNVQLAFLAVAGIFCVWLPARSWAKIAAVALLVLASFTPRALQLLHPDGHYHSLTLTGYAVLVAGAAMIVLRAGRTFVRNVSIVGALFLVAGYVVQCNWISTVNYLNTLAHFETLTQVLARVRSLPDAGWDGKKIAVVGSYDMPSDYPFKPYVAVASRFMDAKHMDYMARLMRDEATFVATDETMPNVLDFANTHPPWPHPGSVGIVGGMGVVVFSKGAAVPR